MHPERQLYVLACDLARPAAQVVEEIAPPDLESADRTQHEVETRPRDSVVVERSEVVDRLVRQQRPGVRNGEGHSVRQGTRRVFGDLDEACEADDSRWVA